MRKAATRYSISVENPLRASFDVYLNDKHAALDLVASCTCDQARNLLRDLYIQAPHAVAKAMALRYPYTAEQADEVERVIQDTLL